MTVNETNEKLDRLIGLVEDLSQLLHRKFDDDVGAPRWLECSECLAGGFPGSPLMHSTTCSHQKPD